MRKAFKKDKLIVKKTDDEIVRYIKQNTIIQERKRYEDLMQKEKERKAKGLNDQEKRLIYFDNIESLEERVYNKPRINDNQLEFNFLHDRKNYKPLGQKYRPFFIKPYYAKMSDFSTDVPFKTYVIRFLGSLILLKLGYEFGNWDGEYFNEKFRKNKVVEMETEEQIYDYLYNKDKTAVFIYLYSPGHYLFERFNKDFEIWSAKYE